MKALTAQGFPWMASVPAVTAFELSRFAYALASPSQLKQGDFTHKLTPPMLPRSGTARITLLNDLIWLPYIKVIANSGFNRRKPALRVKFPYLTVEYQGLTV